MWSSWHWFEPAIRRLAALGRSPTLPASDRYEVRNADCDVLVVGGGVAGMSAALGAARCGLRVWLAEQDEELGGYARWCPTKIQGQYSGDWIHAVKNVLCEFENARILTRTIAVGSYDHGVMTLSESCRSNEAARKRFWILRARRVVLATGTIEQPLIFDHNDRRGIILAGAAHRFLKCHAIAPGRRVLVATNNDSAYAVARDLFAASVRVVGIADSRVRVSNPIAMELRAVGIPIHLGTLPLTTSGLRMLRSVTLAKIVGDTQPIQPIANVPCGTLLVSGGWNPSLPFYGQLGARPVTVGKVAGNGQPIRRISNIACDALLMSGGWSPSLELYGQARGKLAFMEDISALAPTTSALTMAIVGAAALIEDINTAVQHATEGGVGSGARLND